MVQIKLFSDLYFSKTVLSVYNNLYNIYITIYAIIYLSFI